MEDLFFVKNGILRLPPGFRFNPTDEEVVLHYLKRKIQSLPLSLPIPEADVFGSDPWNLPGDPLQQRYFFSAVNNLPSHPTTISGFWEDSGLEDQVVDSRNQQVVGAKNTFLFFTGEPHKKNETNWILHEYKLGNSFQGMDSWVLCRLFLKKNDVDFELDLESGSSSSSESSGVTDVDEDEDEDEDDEEEINK